ncbi:MAG: mechanosensitive ion channel family protein [Gammaproteobacteria bacterium]|nr:MAG: mechanosensitive ion channel family protein [Gammaproteobacteria bacterium]
MELLFTMPRRLSPMLICIALWPMFSLADTTTAAAVTATETNDEDALTMLGTVLGTVFEQTPLWGWGALFLGILGGLAVGKIASSVLNGIGKRLTDQGLRMRGILFEAPASPSSLLCLSLGIQLGLLSIVMPPEVAAFAQNLLKFLLLLSFGWIAFNLVDLIDIAIMRRVEESNSKLAAQLAPLIRKTFRIFVVIVFFLFIAQNVFGVNISAWLAGLGIAGLAISLASQDSVRNLFGSITVMLDKPFAVGDRISFSGIDGFVEEIGLRSSRIRTFTGHIVTIPNMRFIDGTVENISARPFLRRTLDVTITYDTPPEKVEEAVQIIKDILAAEDMAAPFQLDKRPPRIYFNDFNSASLNIAVSYWYFLSEELGHDWWGFLAHGETFNHRLLRAFNEAGIEFAFPTQTLYLAGDPARELNVRARIDPSTDASGQP